MLRNPIIAPVCAPIGLFIVTGCGDNLPEGVADKRENVQSHTGGRKPEEIIQSIQADSTLTPAQKEMRIQTIKERNHIK